MQGAVLSVPALELGCVNRPGFSPPFHTGGQLWLPQDCRWDAACVPVHSGTDGETLPACGKQPRPGGPCPCPTPTVIPEPRLAEQGPEEPCLC